MKCYIPSVGLKFVGWRRPALKFLKLCRGTILFLSCGHTIFLKFSKLLKAAAGGGPPQKPDADGQFGTGWGALSACLEKLPSGPKHQVSRTYHLTSDWDDMCGPYMLSHSARIARGARPKQIFFKILKSAKTGATGWES